MRSMLLLATLKKTAMFGLLLLLPAFAKAQSADSPEITDLMRQAREHAVLAEADAEKLESYTRSNLSWQSHGNRLSQMQEHSNDLIQDFNKLSSMRSNGSPWQQEAIDRVNPLLHEMADHLEATIRHFNENQSKVHMPPFRDYAKANLELMTRTNRLITDYVDYAEAKTKASLLEKTLQSPMVASETE